MTDKQESVLSELTQGVKEKVTNQKLFADHEQRAFTPQEATDAAMRAFIDHLHDPRTVERACVAYFEATGSHWGQLNDHTQEMWRRNIQAILKAALE